MWPLVTFTICFRGLLVIHRVESVQPNFFEVGIVDDDVHFLRINTIKNGVLAATKFLKKEDLGLDNRHWRLEVNSPLAPGVSTYIQDDPKHPNQEIDRKKHPYERDYRWITELHDVFPDMNLEQNINADNFSSIVKIPNGIFSTRLKSELLSKIVNGSSENFGAVAAVVACDIPTLAGSVRLLDQMNNPLFTFDADENTIYEFANTPADVPALHHGPSHDHDREHGHEGAPVTDACQDNHFKRYYKLFTEQPRDSICFTETDPAPAPDPATCGAAGAGTIKNPFGGGS